MASPRILTREFILCFFAQFTISSVLCLLIPTLPIYFSRFGAKESEIGVLIGAFNVTALVVRPFVGKALSRVSGKNFMLGGALLYAAASVGYLLVPPLWPHLFVRILHGVGLGLFSTASFTLVSNLSSEKHRAETISYFYLSINLAMAFAPYFGMILINRFSFTILFLACLCLSLCALSLVVNLEGHNGDSSEIQSPGHLSFLTREMIDIAMMAFMVNIIWGTVIVFFPLHALNHGVENPGIFFAVYAFVTILGRSLGGRIPDIYGRTKVIFPCLIVLIVSMILLSISTNLKMFILVAIIWGAGMSLLYPTLIAYAVDRAGSHRGQALGTFTALADLGAGIGPVIMGVVLENAGYPAMFLCLALISVIGLLYFYLFVRKMPK